MLHFITQKQISDEYFNMPIWSINRPNYTHISVASGHIAGYSLACNQESRWMFATIMDFFLNYWKNHDIMVDYMIVLAQMMDQKIGIGFNSIS